MGTGGDIKTLGQWQQYLGRPLHKKIIVADIHKGATHSIEKDFIELVRRARSGEVKYNDIWIVGDFFDFAGILKSEIPQHIDEYIQYCREFKDHLLLGNHELNIHQKYPELFANLEVLPVDFGFDVLGVCYTHGDRGLLWSTSRSIEFRSKKEGRSKLSRVLIEIGHRLNSLVQIERGSKISKEHQKRIVDFMRLYASVGGVHTIVMGHRHPKKKIDIVVKHENKLYRIIVVKRGVHEIWV